MTLHSYMLSSIAQKALGLQALRALKCYAHQVGRARNKKGRPVGRPLNFSVLAQHLWCWLTSPRLLDSA